MSQVKPAVELAAEIEKWLQERHKCDASTHTHTSNTTDGADSDCAIDDDTEAATAVAMDVATDAATAIATDVATDVVAADATTKAAVTAEGSSFVVDKEDGDAVSSAGNR